MAVSLLHVPIGSSNLRLSIRHSRRALVGAAGLTVALALGGFASHVGFTGQHAAAVSTWPVFTTAAASSPALPKGSGSGALGEMGLQEPPTSP